MNGFWRKWIMNGIVIIPLLIWFTEAGFFASLIASTIFTVAAWYIGDRWILPASSNTTATLADAALAFLYFWFVADLMDWALSIGELFVLTAAIAIVEWIFHRQLARQERIDRDEGKSDLATERFATEFGEDTGAEDLRRRGNEEER